MRSHRPTTRQRALLSTIHRVRPPPSRPRLRSSSRPRHRCIRLLPRPHNIPPSQPSTATCSLRRSSTSRHPPRRTSPAPQAPATLPSPRHSRKTASTPWPSSLDSQDSRPSSMKQVKSIDIIILTNLLK